MDDLIIQMSYLTISDDVNEHNTTRYENGVR